MLFSQCIDEVEKYEIVTDDPDSNYTNPYQELFESVCYSDCNGNGICENGNIDFTIVLVGNQYQCLKLFLIYLKLLFVLSLDMFSNYS